MKLFLVFLLVASCQALDLFDTSSYEATKGAELKTLVEAAEEEMFNFFLKEYPDVDPKMLQELAHEIAILFKNEVDAVLALVDQGSEMAKKLTHNMWENLKKAAVDMVHGLDSIPESLKKFLDDLTRDIEEMENHGVFDIYLDELFDHVTDKVAYKLEYGALERRDIWGQLNDTLHRIIGHLSGRFNDLKDFFNKSVKVGIDKLHPHLLNIRKLAEDVLSNISVVSKAVAQQALEFFKPFAQQLGDLWTKLVKRIHDRFHIDVPPTF